MAFELQSKKAVNDLVTSAISHTAKGDQIVHEAASQAIGHAEKHGDTRPIDRLMKGLGKSIRVEGLRVWVEAYSPVRWNGDGKVGLLKDGMKGFVPFNVEDAFANPFWTLATADEKVAKPLDLIQLIATIKGMRRKVEKAQKEDRFEGDENQALRFLSQMETFVDVFTKTDPIHDGAYDPNDPDNAKPATDPADDHIAAMAEAVNTKDEFADDAAINVPDAVPQGRTGTGVPAPLPAPRKARGGLKKAA